MTDGFLSRFAFSEAEYELEVPDHPFLCLEWTFKQFRRRHSPLQFSSVRPPRCLLEGVSRPPAKPFELDGGVNLWSARRKKEGGSQ